jgi:hypothetical protein
MAYHSAGYSAHYIDQYSVRYNLRCVVSYVMYLDRIASYVL